MNSNQAGKTDKRNQNHSRFVGFLQPLYNSASYFYIKSLLTIKKISMKSLNTLNILSILFMALLVSGCGKDDDSSTPEPGPTVGYFPTQISTNVFENPSKDATFNFSYNDYNEITKITQAIGSDTYTNTFTYTNHLLTEASFDNGSVVYSITYDASGRIASLSEGGETAISFAYDETFNKYTWEAGSNTAYVDFNQNNAIEAMYIIYSNTSISTSAEKDGVFKNLPFQPALSLVLGVFALTNFDLYLLSPSAITGYNTAGTIDSDNYTIENTRDGNDNIVSATYIYSDGTPREELSITYEERGLNP